MLLNRFHRYAVIASVLCYRTSSLQVRAISMKSSTARVPRETDRTEPLSYMDADLSKLVDDRLMSVPGFSIDQLMELAGYGVASAVLDHWNNFDRFPPNKSILIFCGPGNNGGDGLVAARHLKHFGFSPTVVYPKRGKTPLFCNLSRQLEDLDIAILDKAPSSAEYDTYSLAVDSLFGFSFKGPSREPFTSMIEMFAKSPIPVFSVDIPSGWDVNQGDIHKTGFVPNAVISLTAPKLCMKNFDGFHYISGRFVPAKLAAELGLVLPDYGTSSKQHMLLNKDRVQKGSIGAHEDQEPVSAIYVTAPSFEEARRLATVLLERRLVACVNLLPGVESMYEWQGRLETAQEVLMMIKTRRSLAPSVTAAVQELHSYEVPEVLAVDVTGGSDAYLQWVRKNTADAGAAAMNEIVAAGQQQQSLCEAGAVTSHATTGDVLRTGSASKVADESIRYTTVGTSDACSV